jgi:threonine dehydrogenase-like Zn-dependent dehydrogenase
MRALVYNGQLALHGDLTASRDERAGALLRILKAGICNTDLELIKGYLDFSGILGHEFVGVVEQGPDRLLGKRVTGEINVACGACDLCLKGIPSQCRRRYTVGIFRYPGAFADFLPLPERNLHIVPDTVSDEAAVFTEPLAAALQVVEAVHVSPRDRVVVLGAGKLGMLAAQVLKLTGADVIVPVRREKQAHLLEQWRIPAVDVQDLPPERAQVVVDCTGQADGFAEALRLVEARGTIVLKSTYVGLPQADLTRIAVKEIRIVGSRCGPFDAALRLMERGLVDVDSLIEARYPLDEGIRALEHAAEKGVLKVLLEVS